MDTTLNGPRLTRYYSDPVYKIDWEEVTDPPKPWRHIWVASVGKRPVGELWQGKTGRWYGLVYDRVTMWGPVQYDIALMMVGLILGPVV